MESAHAILSPSSAHRWVRCPGSVVMTRPYPRTTSRYAAEGTAAHELAAMALRASNNADANLGRVIEADGFEFTVDKVMADAVQVYLDTIRAKVETTGAELLVEQALPIETMTNEKDATGTGDAILIIPSPDGDEIGVDDLKFGQGVKVDAEDNEQLFMYGYGALMQYGALGDFKRVRMTIHQPRLEHVSEWVLDIGDMLKWRDKIWNAAQLVHESMKPEVDIGDFLVAGEKQCRFCEAKAGCPALARFTAASIFTAETAMNADEFPDLDEFDTHLTPQEGQPMTTPLDMLAALTPADLRRFHALEADACSKIMPVVDLIRTWCTAIENRTEELLHQGVDVTDYKLVEGKRGNRAWTDRELAEAKLKGMRLKQDQMYKFSLISPTDAEKLLEKDAPKRWKALQDLIVRADGQPTVAHVSDKRPAIIKKPVVEDFADVTQAEPDDGSDLC